jgi:hypothetical protein
MKSKGNLWKVLLGIIICGLLCIILPLCISLPLIIWKGVLPGDHFIKLVSTFLSWPIAVALICLVFLFRFQSSIQDFLGHIASMKLPGGIEVQREAPILREPSSSTEDGSRALSLEEIEKIKSTIDDLEQKIQLTDEDRKLYKEALNRVYIDKTYWKFQYLSLYFVPNTKNVLYWISKLGPCNKQQFHRDLATIIPNQSQREIILTVLIENKMITEENDELKITNEGYLFLQFIGKIPFPPIQERTT